MSTINCAPMGVYSWQLVVVTIDGAKVDGVWEGDDAIIIERNTQLGEPMTGADGSSIVSITADQSAKITLKLQPTSPMHNWLKNKRDRMRMGSVKLTFPMSVVDMSTGETGSCTQAIITKEPDVAYGAHASERVWEFFCPCWLEGGIEINRG